MRINKNFFLVISLAIFSSLIFSEWVKVKSPNGGEQWQLGSKQTITWDKSGDFTGFQIILRKANKKVGDIGWVLNPNTTSFLWKKVGEYEGGTVAAGNDYKIRVRGYLANGGKIDDSDNNFYITDKPKQGVQIGKMNWPKLKVDLRGTLSVTPYKPNTWAYITLTIHNDLWGKVEDPTGTHIIEVYYKGTKIHPVTPKLKVRKWTFPGPFLPPKSSAKIKQKTDVFTKKYGIYEIVFKLDTANEVIEANEKNNEGNIIYETK